MASDDNESKSEPTESPDALPPEVERALAKARATVGKSRQPLPGRKSSRWLALIPVTAAILTTLLMLPHAAAPEDIPLPQIDQKALEAVRMDDNARAAAARATRLSGAALLVGTRLRALNRAQAKNAPPEDVADVRTALEVGYHALVAEEKSTESLRTLRAVQLETFLTEVQRFESTGQPSEELEEIAGGFISRMTAAGWINGHTVVLDDAQRRVAYKLVWNATVGANRAQGMALSLDEQRVLYTLYFTHPHASEGERAGFVTRRRMAATDAECATTDRLELMATEQWRAEKIKRLGEIDPTYPTAFALGIAHYRAGQFERSMEDFQSWLAAHPDGAYAIRARNHMKAALAMSGSS